MQISENIFGTSGIFPVHQPLNDTKLVLEKSATSRDTAQKVEAFFLSLLLKEMRQTLEPEGLFPGDSGDIHGGMFDYLIGEHMAASGRFGLAAMLESVDSEKNGAQTSIEPTHEQEPLK
jgi:Rod binding domain-containing protein